MVQIKSVNMGSMFRLTYRVKFKDASNVFAPSFAQAAAASHPACPAPTTITSYLNII